MPGLLAVITGLLLTLGTAPEVAGTSPSSAPAPVLSCADIFRMTQDDQYDNLIADASEQWKVDPFILKGLLWEESRLDASIINSKSGAAGIAQFTKTGRVGLTRIRKMRGDDEEFTRKDALDPEKAIPASAELLSYLISRWGRNSGIAHYNGGKYKRWFMWRVLRRANQYRTESGLPPLPARPPRTPPLVS
jgi:soluble lytic murein transglycosylase-like protein